jgi:hypothetical protein
VCGEGELKNRYKWRRKEKRIIVDRAESIEKTQIGRLVIYLGKGKAIFNSVNV